MMTGKPQNEGKRNRLLESFDSHLMATLSLSENSRFPRVVFIDLTLSKVSSMAQKCFPNTPENIARS